MKTLIGIIEDAKYQIYKNYGVKISVKFEIDFENREKIVAQTLRIVSSESGVIQSFITGKLRDKEIVSARYVTMYLLRNFFGLKLVNIGFYLNKDHTTVMHACKQAEDYLDINYEPFCNLLNKCLNQIQNEKNKN